MPDLAIATSRRRFGTSVTPDLMNLKRITLRYLPCQQGYQYRTSMLDDQTKEIWHILCPVWRLCSLRFWSERKLVHFLDGQTINILYSLCPIWSSFSLSFQGESKLIPFPDDDHLLQPQQSALIKIAKQASHYISLNVRTKCKQQHADKSAFSIDNVLSFIRLLLIVLECSGMQSI